MKHDHPIRRFFTERRIALLIRWWMAGAVYFFVGWGTRLGSQDMLIDFVLTLGLVLGLMNILFVNPGIRMMFNVMPLRIPGKETTMQRISDYLVELLKNIFIVLMVGLIYIGINKVLIALLGLPQDAVPLPGEPILFGAFYVVVFVLIAAVVDRIRRQRKKSPKGVL